MQGFSKIFTQIIEKKKIITAPDLTPEQKQRLYELMCRYGATSAFTYDRFFEHGFSEWEIEGIDACKKDFLALHNAIADDDTLVISSDYTPEEGVTDEDVKRLHTMATMYNGRGDFFKYISAIRGLRTEFYNYMSDKGLKSNTTVLKRFSTDNWIPWERKGMRSILTEYVKTEEAIATANI